MAIPPSLKFVALARMGAALPMWSRTVISTGTAEVPAALALHEPESGVEAAQGRRGCERFLQNEVCPHLKRLLGGSLPVQDGERYRSLVAWSPAQVSQNIHAALQVIAIDDYGVKLRSG
jgi:hypothetical protein